MSVVGRYTSWDLVKGRYPSAQSGTAQTSVSSYYISGAEAELDGRVGKVYVTPFIAPIPGFISDLATDMAYYKMVMFQKNAQILKTSIDERIKGLIDGSIIIVASGTGLASGNTAWISDSYHSVFGHDDPTNWRADWDQLSADINGRT